MDTYLLDGRWHHVAMTLGPSFFGVYLDGEDFAECRGDFNVQPSPPLLRFGILEVQFQNANAAPFTGDIDDVRLYRRQFADKYAIRSEIMQRPPTPTELQNDMILHLDFDGDTVVNRAAVLVIVKMGGGLVVRSPELVGSTAPLFSSATAGILYLEGLQDLTTSTPTPIVANLLAVTPIYGQTMTVESAKAAVTIQRVDYGAQGPGAIGDMSLGDWALTGAPQALPAQVGPVLTCRTGPRANTATGSCV